jgi:hypothetical protein
MKELTPAQKRLLIAGAWHIHSALHQIDESVSHGFYEQTWGEADFDPNLVLEYFNRTATGVYDGLRGASSRVTNESSDR